MKPEDQLQRLLSGVMNESVENLLIHAHVQAFLKKRGTKISHNRVRINSIAGDFLIAQLEAADSKLEKRLNEVLLFCRESSLPVPVECEILARALKVSAEFIADCSKSTIRLA